MNKKGFTLQQIAPIAIVLVIVGITIALGQTVNDDFAEDACTDAGYYYNATQSDCFENGTGGNAVAAGRTYEFNATKDSMEGNSTLSDYLPTIALVVAVAIVLGILVTYLMRRM